MVGLDVDAVPPESDALPEVLAERVPIKWHIPVGLGSRYAHHMLVQASDFEVTISFFELKPPVILGDISREEQQRILKEGVLAECVARVTVARERYPEFLKAFMGVMKQEESNSE